jgi:NADH/NAD ratio-sensing transcriptional regulator Rex
MIRLVTLPVLVLVAAISTALAEEGQRLSSDQMAKAVKSDSITVPTPGELFAALGKSGKINWSAQYRAPIPVT